MVDAHNTRKGIDYKHHAYGKWDYIEGRVRLASERNKKWLQNAHAVSVYYIKQVNQT